MKTTLVIFVMMFMLSGCDTFSFGGRFKPTELEKGDKVCEINDGTKSYWVSEFTIKVYCNNGTEYAYNRMIE